MIIFKTLRFRNILGFGNYETEITLSSHNTNLVVGLNGAGKSTFLDAICFVLYGKPFRNINKPNLVNSITYRGLLVEIDFEVNNRSYRIIRGIKPNIFEIYKDGTLIDQTTGILDYQAILEKQILKMNFKSFTQIVILGSTNYTPFMKLPAQARRDVIEDFLDIQVFSIMNTLLKDKINKNKSEIQEVEYQIDLCQNKISMNERHIQALKENNESLIAERLETIERYKSDSITETLIINTSQSQLKTLQFALRVKTKRCKAIDSILAIGDELQDKVKRLKKEFDFYADHDTCPTCKQMIDEEFREEVMMDKDGQIDVIKVGLKDLEKERIEKNKLGLEIVEYEVQSQALNSKITEAKTKIESHLRYINDLTKEVEQYRNRILEIKTDDNLTQQLYAELASLTKRKDDLTQDRELHQASAVLLKDGGIKGRIVQQYIPIINKLINYYLNELDFFVNFELDEHFNEKIKSRHRDEFQYESFSEGEKVRINLALLFAWMAIAKMRNSAACSLLIMDEILDGSLDLDGTDMFLKLLKPIAEERNIFVISHKWNLQDKFDRTLEFRKEKNFSYLQ